jgi:hypothetical protein
VIIAAESRAFVTAALQGDAALDSLVVTGTSPDTLEMSIQRGVPQGAVGGSTYDPAPPFRREILVELVLRMQRLRWRSAAPFMPAPPPPDRKDLYGLRESYARATVPFECGEGWVHLLGAIFSWLEEIAPDHEWAPSQIKTKYGGLRFYYYGELTEIGEEIMEAAEHLSEYVCETCGAPGRLRSRQGWWTTCCAYHKKPGLW